MYTINILGKEI